MQANLPSLSGNNAYISDSIARLLDIDTKKNNIFNVRIDIVRDLLMRGVINFATKDSINEDY